MSKFRRGLALVITFVVATSLLMPAQAANAASSAASAVRSLKVSDGWNSSSPRTAVAKLSWTKPSSTYGYSIVGYRIEKSYDKNTWTTVISSTKSTATSKTISSGLKIGITNYFRVKAITKKGSITKVGAPSSVVGKSLTAMPLAPVLLGLNDLVTFTDSYRPYWIPQTPSQAGSAKPTYVVTATSSGQTAATCTSTSNSCDLTGLVPNTAYKISLTVKNSRGTAENLAAFNASDPELSRQWYLGESGGISAARAAARRRRPARRR